MGKRNFWANKNPPDFWWWTRASQNSKDLSQLSLLRGRGGHEGFTEEVTLEYCEAFSDSLSEKWSLSFLEMNPFVGSLEHRLPLGPLEPFSPSPHPPLHSRSACKPPAGIREAFILTQHHDGSMEKYNCWDFWECIYLFKNPCLSRVQTKHHRLNSSQRCTVGMISRLYLSVAIPIRWSTQWPQLRNTRDISRRAESTRKETKPKLDGDRMIERERQRH